MDVAQYDTASLEEGKVTVDGRGARIHGLGIK